MDTLKIYLPHKPYIVTQSWGNPNTIYADQFSDPNFKLHNGMDSVTGYLDWQGNIKTDFLVHCPVEGFYVEKVLFVPKGGGNEIHLKSKEKLQIGDKACYAYLILCHAKKILVSIGYEPKIGELLMISDSTGFSTGLHLHIGLYRVGDNGNKLDQNEATGSYNPLPFFQEAYATDVASVSTLVKSGLRLARYYAGF